MSGRNRGGNKRKKNTGGGNNSAKNSNKKKFDAGAFWGEPAAIPNPEGFDTSTPDPVAVVNSLGQPPLPGHGAASPHYFKLVYTRATQLAGALAMAGEIDDLTPDDPPEPEMAESAETEADVDDELTEASADDELSASASAADGPSDEAE